MKHYTLDESGFTVPLTEAQVDALDESGEGYVCDDCSQPDELVLHLSADYLDTFYDPNASPGETDARATRAMLRRMGFAGFSI